MAVSQTEIDALIHGSSLDEYGLRRIPFKPDVIYDIGANVGGVTLLASKLFPEAKIVALEPQSDNFDALLKITGHLPNVIHLNTALGDGPIRRSKNSPGSGNWIFVPKGSPTDHEEFIDDTIPWITLDSLIEEYGGKKIVVKMDCESGELVAIRHKPSMEALLKSWWIGAEIHVWGKTHDLRNEVAHDVMMFIDTLSHTHTIDAKFWGGSVNFVAEMRNRKE